MKSMLFNPFLKLNEYVPDGEAHIFGDRVYLYGSHDKANSDRFCVQDYVVYSASVNDLSNRTFEGVSYKKSQDPRSKENVLPDLYAPDCVKGNDGKYYLYYVAMGPNVKPFGPISVARSDNPVGPFEYIGDIKYKSGELLLKYLNNDPAVINDNGHIYLYYGWAIPYDLRNIFLKHILNLVESKLFGRSVKEIKKAKPSIMGCAFCELENDMLTVKGETKLVLDSKTTSNKHSKFYKHAFYEAPSIRKINSTYYLIYSLGQNNELAYATSKFPDKDFKYRGVIISNSDLGLNGNEKSKKASGTIHGSIEKINDNFYVFYHRSTNNTDYSRQACVEKIELLSDGSIKQVEVTSLGFNDKSLAAEGCYNSAICCNLYGKKKYKFGNKKGQKYPRISEEKDTLFIKDICNDTVIGYKYFNLEKPTSFSIVYRGEAKGIILVSFDETFINSKKIKINSSDLNVESNVVILQKDSKSPLFLKFIGKGKIDLYSIKFAYVAK